MIFTRAHMSAADGCGPGLPRFSSPLATLLLYRLWIFTISFFVLPFTPEDEVSLQARPTPYQQQFYFKSLWLWNLVSCIKGGMQAKGFENRILRRIFRPKSNEWRRLHYEELHSLHHSPNIVRVIKSWRLKWAEWNAFKILTGIPTGKRPLWRSRRRWEENIRMNL